MGLRSKPRFCFWNCGVRRSLSKKYEDTFSLIVLFSDEKYQKSSKDFPSLENLPASSRFALCKQPSPSGANIASVPSDNCVTIATGSKRPRADSDSLLCHVGLWRTSRSEFLRKSLPQSASLTAPSQMEPCKKFRFLPYPVSAGIRPTMPRLGDANTHASHMC